MDIPIGLKSNTRLIAKKYIMHRYFMQGQTRFKFGEQS